MQVERKYGFRNELNQGHKPNRRDYSVRMGENEVEVTDGWQIIIGAGASEVLVNAAKDLADYFFVSMNVVAGVKEEGYPSE